MEQQEFAKDNESNSESQSVRGDSGRQVWRLCQKPHLAQGLVSGALLEMRFVAIF